MLACVVVIVILLSVLYVQHNNSSVSEGFELKDKSGDTFHIDKASIETAVRNIRYNLLPSVTVPNDTLKRINKELSEVVHIKPVVNMLYFNNTFGCRSDVEDDSTELSLSEENKLEIETLFIYLDHIIENNQYSNVPTSLFELGRLISDFSDHNMPLHYVTNNDTDLVHVAYGIDDSKFPIVVSRDSSIYGDSYIKKYIEWSKSPSVSYVDSVNLKM